MPRTKLSRLVAAVMAASVTASLAGCGLVIGEGPPGSGIEDSIIKALDSHKAEGVASINFSDLVPGEWDRMVIICYNATPAQVDEALGFRWGGTTTMDYPGFNSYLVFESGDQVEKYVNVGVRDIPEFTPCSIPSDSYSRPLPPPIVLPRASAILPFTLHPERDYNRIWFVPYDSLIALSGTS